MGSGWPLQAVLLLVNFQTGNMYRTCQWRLLLFLLQENGSYQECGQDCTRSQTGRTMPGPYKGTFRKKRKQPVPCNNPGKHTINMVPGQYRKMFLSNVCQQNKPSETGKRKGWKLAKTTVSPVWNITAKRHTEQLYFREIISVFWQLIFLYLVDQYRNRAGTPMTLAAILPSSTFSQPVLPREAMKIRSHPFFRLLPEWKPKAIWKCRFPRGI